MPKLSQTVEVAIELEATLEAQFLQELRAYQTVKAEFDDLAKDLAASKELLERMRESAGYLKLRFPGDYGITRVAGGTSKSLNKKKVYALGITAKQLADCYTEKPKKAHTLIILPGDEEKAAKAKAAMPRHEDDDYEDRE